MRDAIQAVGLAKLYGSRLPWRPTRQTLSGLDLRVPPGGITGLLGPNGAGKTTAVRILLGLTRPSAGHAEVFGLDTVRESLAVRRQTAFVPQERQVFGWMRAADFVGRVAAVSSRWDPAYASRLWQRWQIDPGMRLRDLSSGTRSRLLLLVALARRCRLFVLDEPTTGLDPATLDDALSEVAVAAADGATVLLVTHRLDEVERICDRVAIVDGGCTVLEGDLDDLRGAWRVVEVAGHPAPERMSTWDEVVRVTPRGRHARALIRSNPEAVVDRIRLVGAEVVGVRPVTLREIYLAITRADTLDDPPADLA